MDALTVLRELAALADDALSSTIANLTPEQALWRGEGSTANTIAATLLHVYLGEDRFVQSQRGTAPIFASGGWAAKIGLGPDEIWTATAVDLPQLRAYVEAVRAGTRSYFETVDPATLDAEVDTARGRRRVAFRLGMLLVLHKGTHLGDIATLLGLQGLKGFPA